MFSDDELLALQQVNNVEIIQAILCIDREVHHFGFAHPDYRKEGILKENPYIKVLFKISKTKKNENKTNNTRIDALFGL